MEIIKTKGGKLNGNKKKTCGSEWERERSEFYVRVRVNMLNEKGKNTWNTQTYVWRHTKYILWTFEQFCFAY